MQACHAAPRNAHLLDTQKRDGVVEGSDGDGKVILLQHQVRHVHVRSLAEWIGNNRLRMHGVPIIEGG